MSESITAPSVLFAPVTRRILHELGIGALLISSMVVHAESPACLSAPELPLISATDAGVDYVTNEEELQNAVNSLTDNKTILIAPGEYYLSETLYIRHDNVTIRGESNRCDAIILAGQGMENTSIEHGIWTDKSKLKVQNLTIRDVYRHPIIINPGGQSPEIYNVRLLNAGEQFVKANPLGFNDGVNYGRVEYSIIKYTEGTPTTSHGAGGLGYLQGIDVQGGNGWVIRKNRFENLHTPDNADLHNWFNAAVLMWKGSSNPIVEDNVFIDVDRAISFGLDPNTPSDNRGGMIRNNMIMMRAGLYSDARTNESDAPIIVWNSENTKVFHNTIVTNQNTRKAIELRFNSADGQIRNNLIQEINHPDFPNDKEISHRDNQSFSATDNILFTDMSIFRDEDVGDLHLITPVDSVSGVVPVFEEARYDIDGEFRDRTGQSDAGADKY